MFVKKSGSVSTYILGDLKPCVPVDVFVDGRTIHVERALFDTGADITVLNPSRVSPDTALQDEILIVSVDAKDRSGYFFCSLSIGDGEIVLEHIPIYVTDIGVFDATDIDLIIGMDVIKEGALSITRKGTLPVLTFEI